MSEQVAVSRSKGLYSPGEAVWKVCEGRVFKRPQSGLESSGDSGSECVDGRGRENSGRGV